MSLESRGTHSTIWVKKRVHRTYVDPSTSGTFIHVKFVFAGLQFFKEQHFIVLKTSLGEHLEGYNFVFYLFPATFPLGLQLLLPMK
jgi:hypothetical protein